MKGLNYFMYVGKRVSTIQLYFRRILIQTEYFENFFWKSDQEWLIFEWI